MAPPPAAENTTVKNALDKIEQGHPLRSTSTRERLVIVLLAVTTAIGVLLAVLDPWARLERLNRTPPDKPPCQGNQPQGCVGGKVDVFVLPASAAGR